MTADVRRNCLRDTIMMCPLALRSSPDELLRAPTIVKMLRRARPPRDASEVGVTERRTRCLKTLLPTGGLRSRVTSVRELPENVQRGLDLTGEGNGVNGTELSGEAPAAGGRSTRPPRAPADRASAGRRSV